MNSTTPEATPQPTYKLYTERAINIATFFGGPIAAGILIRRNFINLGNEEYGKHAIAIAVVSMVLLIVGISYMPETENMDKLGKFFPIVITAIVAGILHKYQGEDLKVHEKNFGTFYSGWRAAGIGFLSMAGIFAFIFGYVMFDDPGFDSELYDQKVTEFNDNEETALILFDYLENDEVEKSAKFIYSTGIPSWQKNLNILNEMDQIEHLDPEFITQDSILRVYCNLRIESYQLISKSLREDYYDPKIDEINAEIDKTLLEL